MKPLSSFRISRENIKEFSLIKTKKVFGVYLDDDYTEIINGEERLFQKGSVYLIDQETFISPGRLGKTLIEIKDPAGLVVVEETN